MVNYFFKLKQIANLYGALGGGYTRLQNDFANRTVYAVRSQVPADQQSSFIEALTERINIFRKQNFENEKFYLNGLIPRIGLKTNWQPMAFLALEQQVFALNNQFRQMGGEPTNADAFTWSFLPSFIDSQQNYSASQLLLASHKPFVFDSLFNKASVPNTLGSFLATKENCALAEHNLYNSIQENKWVLVNDRFLVKWTGPRTAVYLGPEDSAFEHGAWYEMQRTRDLIDFMGKNVQLPVQWIYRRELQGSRQSRYLISNLVIASLILKGVFDLDLQSPPGF